MDNLAVTFMGKDLVELHDIDMPRPPAGSVVIETSRTLISTGTEGIALQRKFSPGTHWDGWVKYPFHPGYCGVGRVVELGEGVKNVAVGDRVSVWSGHQQYGVAPAVRAVRVPEGVSDEEAAWCPMAEIAQHGFRKADVQLGETVVIVGMGILGQLTVQYARLAGAGEIIAIDPAALRLEMARKNGATRALAVGAGEAEEAVKEITGGAMADVLFDITGHPLVFAAAHQLLGDNGRMVLTGDTGSPEQQHMTSQFIQKNLTVMGAHQRTAAKSAWHHARMGALFLKYLQRGQMNVKDLITHRFPVRKAPEAYALLMARREEAMGVILDFAGLE